MKPNTLLLFCISCSLLIFAACKKSSNSSTTTQELTGTWKHNSSITDVNNNQTIDAADIVIADSVTTLYIFKSGGVFLSSNPTTPTDIKWSLVFSDTYLSLSSATIGNESYHIDNISSTAMTLRDTDISTNGTTQWEVFSKQ